MWVLFEAHPTYHHIHRILYRSALHDPHFITRFWWKDLILSFDHPRMALRLAATWAVSWRWVSDPKDHGEKILNSIEPGPIAIEPTPDPIQMVGHHCGTRIRIRKCHFPQKTRRERSYLRPVAQVLPPPLTYLPSERAPSIENLEKSRIRYSVPVT